MPPNPSNGYGQPPGYTVEGDVTPSKSDSTMRLLTNSDNGAPSTSPLNRSPYDAFAAAKGPREPPRGTYQPAPTTTDSEISSILREVESDISSNSKTTRAARYKAAKVRFESRDKGSVAPSQMSDSGPPSPLSRAHTNLLRVHRHYQDRPPSCTTRLSWTRLPTDLSDPHQEEDDRQLVPFRP